MNGAAQFGGFPSIFGLRFIPPWTVRRPFSYSALILLLSGIAILHTLWFHNSGTAALKKLSETTSPLVQGPCSTGVVALGLEVQWEGWVILQDEIPVPAHPSINPCLGHRLLILGTKPPPTTPALHGRLKHPVRHATSTSYMVPKPRPFWSCANELGRLGRDYANDQSFVVNAHPTLRDRCPPIALFGPGRRRQHHRHDRMVQRAAIPLILDEAMNLRDFHVMSQAHWQQEFGWTYG
ncbi:hypothetical protein BKA70DRAFT_1400863 [Coprinopsis sp. MPI-PUGE-AT-0042]|nr:hypothetical protein BKA70DRAFT_1400863 [Coprinopsis sp. MPI-PUGE-AT-0042]